MESTVHFNRHQNSCKIMKNEITALLRDQFRGFHKAQNCNSTSGIIKKSRFLECETEHELPNDKLKQLEAAVSRKIEWVKTANLEIPASEIFKCFTQLNPVSNIISGFC
uniref:Uncharacterized protein n=2 Tax=Opuntia streptacantha TaxID=393608 RepID=A0A7C8Z4X2_OPUST